MSTTIINHPAGSTAYKKIDQALNQYPWYREYLHNDLARNDYLKILLEHKSDLEAAGLNEDQIHLSSRFPLNAEFTVEQILYDLCVRDIIPSVDYPKDKFALLFQQVHDSFQHESYTTYIFPEEARLLYALTHITKPKFMIFLGSYYGYWAIYAATILKETGGCAYLIDTDKNVISLAEKNMKQFNVDSVVRLINEDAITFLGREKIATDFIVLDPEGPKQGDDPDLLDKAIYYPMMKAATPLLASNGIVLCHNILLDNPVKEDQYFAKKIDYNYGQFTKFLPFMNENYSQGVWYDTTEGVGVFAHKKHLSPTGDI